MLQVRPRRRLRAMLGSGGFTHWVQRSNTGGVYTAYLDHYPLFYQEIG